MLFKLQVIQFREKKWSTPTPCIKHTCALHPAELVGTAQTCDLVQISVMDTLRVRLSRRWINCGRAHSGYAAREVMHGKATLCDVCEIRLLCHPLSMARLQPCHAGGHSWLTQRGSPLSEELCLKYLVVVGEGNAIAPQTVTWATQKQTLTCAKENNPLNMVDTFFQSHALQMSLRRKPRRGRKRKITAVNI